MKKKKNTHTAAARAHTNNVTLQKTLQRSYTDGNRLSTILSNYGKLLCVCWYGECEYVASNIM